MSTVLMYHSITEDIVNPYLQVTPQSLQRQMQWVTEAGYRLVALADLPTGVPELGDEKLVAVTFDDGYMDNLNARPLFELLGLQPTLFVCAGLVGCWNSWSRRAGFRAELMDVPTLRDLQAAGWDLQCHGWDHRTMAGRETEDLDAELVRCIAWFASTLNLRPQVLAYPFGDLDAVTVACTARHFKLGLTVDSAEKSFPPELRVSRVSCVDIMRREWLLEQLAAQDEGVYSVERVS